MHIVHITAELAPIAKAGGLGDVLLGLPKEQAFQGNNVEIYLPFYDTIDRTQLPSLTFHQKISDTTTLWKTPFEGSTLFLLEESHQKKYFRKGSIYAGSEDAARYVFFCLTLKDYFKEHPPEILHLHDWHAALLAYFAKTEFLPKKTLLTLHNAGYPGYISESTLHEFELTDKTFTDSLKDGPHLCLLKSATQFADLVIPVSPTYAEEIQETLPMFQKIPEKIHGILNGIDSTFWNPEKDPALPKSYQATNSEEAIHKAKQAAKIAIQERFLKTLPSYPWIGCITRLTKQKGLSFIEKAIRKAERLNATFILLGSTSEEKVQHHFEALQKTYENSPHLLLHLKYDEELSHLLYAALDYLIVPSLFEPCGLVQLIAMRYGTVPIVHATGGLKDTVFAQENGFTFSEPKEELFLKTLRLACSTFHEHPLLFHSMQKKGMHSDFSWHLPAKKYQRLYELP